MPDLKHKTKPRRSKPECSRGKIYDPKTKACIGRRHSRAKIVMKKLHRQHLDMKHPKPSRKPTQQKAGWKPWKGSLQQGQPGFVEECRRNLALNGITPKSINLACAKKGEPMKAFGYQMVFDCLVRPDSPLTRMLDKMRAGSGKTFNMVRLLHNYFYDSRPKVLVFPNTAVASNFYDEILIYPSRYKDYLQNWFRSKHWRRDTMTLLQHYEKDFRQWKCPNPDCQQINKNVYQCTACKTLHRLAKQEARDCLDMKSRLHRAGQPGYLAAPLRAFTVNSAGGSQIYNQKHPLIKHARRIGGPSKNPLDSCIVLIDEAHNLFVDAKRSDLTEKRRRLVKWIETAHNMVFCALTATPITQFDKRQEQYKAFMKMVKGPGAENKSTNQGYIFNFNYLLPSLFPRTVPRVGCSLLEDGRVQCVLGRIVYVPMEGRNAQVYVKKHNQYTKKQTKPLNAKQILKLQNYCNSRAYFTRKQDCIADFKNSAQNPKLHHTKLVKIIQDVQSRPQEKTLIIVDRRHGYRCVLEAFRYLFRQQNARWAGFYDETTTEDQLALAGGGNKKKVRYMQLKDEFNKFNPTKDRQYGQAGQKPKIRCLVVDASVFSEGVSFFGVRRLILMNPALNENQWSQRIGRALRACKSHHHLPEAERQVQIDVYCSVLLTTAEAQQMNRPELGAGALQKAKKKSKKKSKKLSKKKTKKKSKKKTQSLRNLLKIPDATADQIALGLLVAEVELAHKFEQQRFVQASVDRGFYQESKPTKPTKPEPEPTKPEPEPIKKPEPAVPPKQKQGMWSRVWKHAKKTAKKVIKKAAEVLRLPTGNFTEVLSVAQ